MKIIDRSVVRIVETVVDQTSSYVSSLMEDVAGYVDISEEQHLVLPPQAEEQMLHADLDPMLDGFGPNMFI
jgi:hypothetical protein